MGIAREIILQLMLHSFNSWSDSKQTTVCFSQVGNDPHLPDTDGYTEPVISKKQEKKKKEKGRERENAGGETDEWILGEGGVFHELA